MNTENFDVKIDKTINTTVTDGGKYKTVNKATKDITGTIIHKKVFYQEYRKEYLDGHEVLNKGYRMHYGTMTETHNPMALPTYQDMINYLSNPENKTEHYFLCHTKKNEPFLANHSWDGRFRIPEKYYTPYMIITGTRKIEEPSFRDAFLYLPISEFFDWCEDHHISMNLARELISGKYLDD